MATTIKKLNSSSTSSAISKLGIDDLLLEVLIRLPDPRSAFRCKPVCKHWNALISTPYFSRHFVSHHQTLPAAVTDEPEPPILTLPQVRQSTSSFLPLPHKNTPKFSVLDATKDLLLLGFWGPENDPELRRTHLLCNPITKQWVALPLAPEMSARDDRYSWIVKLVCEPFDSHGQDDDLGQGQVRFRVVRIYNPETSTASQIDVYVFCSGSCGWTKLVLRLDSDLMYDRLHRVVSMNGKLYWLNQRSQVVAWDLFCAGGLPNVIDGSEISNNFGGPWVSEGALYMMSWRERLGNLESWSVWRPEEKGGWSKQYEVMTLENLRSSGDTIVHACETDILDRMFLNVVGLHPVKSEIVFFRVFFRCCKRYVYLSWNFRKNELDLFTYQDEESRLATYHDEKIFRFTVTLWSNLILRNEKIQSAYNGSHNCWLPTN